MAMKKRTKSHPEVVDYFKELPFYNKHIRKPKIKRLKDIDLLFELPFYEELNVIRTNHAFRWYAMSQSRFSWENLMNQLEASK